MSSSSTAVQAEPGKQEFFSTRVAFFIAGFTMSSWAPLVPLAKARAGLDDGMLGLLLLCLGAGSILTMPVAGYLTARVGCRRVILTGGAVVCLVMPLLATVANPWLLMAAIFFFGAGIGALDCAMNIQAVLVERASGRAMMSGFHGLFSVGGIAGAAGMTGLLSLGLAALPAVLCVVALTVLALWAAGPHLLTSGNGEPGPLLARPRGIVLFLGVLCFIVFQAEGAVLDWSAVFLVGDHGMDPRYAGLGYAAFATTMTIGRLTGDLIVTRLGGARVVIIGGAVAAAGLALSILAPSWVLALIGYALVGAGCSNIVPVLFTAVGRQKTMPQSVAIPAMTSLGYAGILIGPAAIGFIAHASSLSVALGVMVLLLGFVAASGRVLRNV
ncbi:transporter [Pseudomonas sp. M47T1]|uniref:MFS transporter n=1 Tax=Pseudomonas sp. M47T1 TaxID=1179778 RepID=UPI000260730E|nr:MFS transporter [Pseudomonas sp. M47T1]EIK94577.1 transporter [Pseudomonas sp. M47T1]